MRRTIIIALAVLALSLSLCAVGSAAVDRAVAGAEALRQEAEHAARIGNIDAAKAKLRQLYDHWERRGRLLELITSHDALFEARGGIVDAILCLDQGDREEFLRASAALSVALDRLRVTEAFRWANLY